MYLLYYIPYPDKKMYYISNIDDMLKCTNKVSNAKKFFFRDLAVDKCNSLSFRFGLDFFVEEV